MPETGCIGTEEIAEAITSNTKNNFSKIVGLPYFCGGEEKSQTAPHLRCTKDAHQWVKEIESHTQTNWDDSGRIQLAKNQALDSAFTHLSLCVQKEGQNWNQVKRSFLEIYPEEKSLAGLMSELSAVVRKSGETLTELYIRIEGLVSQLETLKPGGIEVYNDMFTSIFLNALPKDFSYVLQEADLKKPLKVYKKALKFVASHPQYKLTDSVVRQEKKQTVNVIGTNLPDTRPTPTAPSKKCQRCGLSNHYTSQCYAPQCFTCHQVGHTSRTCRMPSQRRSIPTCFYCGIPGHIITQCRKKKKTSMYQQHTNPTQHTFWQQ